MESHMTKRIPVHRHGCTREMQGRNKQMHLPIRLDPTLPTSIMVKNFHCRLRACRDLKATNNGFTILWYLDERLPGFPPNVAEVYGAFTLLGSRTISMSDIMTRRPELLREGLAISSWQTTIRASALPAPLVPRLRDSVRQTDHSSCWERRYQ